MSGLIYHWKVMLRLVDGSTHEIQRFTGEHRTEADAEALKAIEAIKGADNDWFKSSFWAHVPVFRASSIIEVFIELETDLESGPQEPDETPSRSTPSRRPWRRK